MKKAPLSETLRRIRTTSSSSGSCELLLAGIQRRKKEKKTHWEDGWEAAGAQRFILMLRCLRSFNSRLQIRNFYKSEGTFAPCVLALTQVLLVQFMNRKQLVSFFFLWLCLLKGLSNPPLHFSPWWIRIYFAPSFPLISLRDIILPFAHSDLKVEMESVWVWVLLRLQLCDKVVW